MSGNPPFSEALPANPRTQSLVSEADTQAGVAEGHTQSPANPSGDAAPVSFNPRQSWTWDTTKIRFDMTGFRWDGTHHPADGWF